MLEIDVESAAGKPAAHVLAIPAQEVRPGWIGRQVNDLRQVDHDQPAVVDEQVVRREVAMGKTGNREGMHCCHALLEQIGQLVWRRSHLCQTRSREAGFVSDELEQDLESVDL